MVREKKIALVAVASLAMSFFAFAEEDGYVRLLKTCGKGTGFAGATWDVKDIKNPSEYNYLVSDDLSFSNKSGEIIPANSITFGVLDGKEGIYAAYYGTTFENKGAIFAKGSCWTYYSSVLFKGNISITSPKTKPFLFYNDGYREGYMNFKGKVSAEKECGIVVYSPKMYNNRPFHVEFSGDISEYYGSIVVTSCYDSVGALIPVELLFTDFAEEFGGDVIIREGATFNPQVSTSVDSLILEAGAILKMNVDCSLVARTEIIAEKGAKLKLLNPNIEPSADAQYKLITMPIESECSLQDFVVVEDDISMIGATELEMKVSEDGKTKSIYVTYYPVVMQIKSNGVDMNDPNSLSAETDGSYWSDGKPVHSKGRYKLERVETSSGSKQSCVLTTRYAPESALSFEGRTLQLASWCKLQLRVKDYSVPRLILQGGGGASEIIGLHGHALTLRSKFVISGTTVIRPLSKLGDNTEATGSIRLVGPITGNADALLYAMGQGETYCGAIVDLDGDNTEYRGKIVVTNYPSKVKFDSRFTTLVIQKAENLGGPRSEFAHDALKLDAASRLEVTDSLTLSEPTRGILVNSKGRFFVPEEKTLTILQQLTINSEVYKEGAGVLALGGTHRFLDASGAVTEEIPEDPARRTFYVVGGKVKPISAYALDGLDVVFSNKTSKLDVGLVLDMNSEDETLRAKGICNVRSPAPFAFLDDDAQKKIPLYLEWDNIPPADEYSFNVMTVKADCADVFDRLQIVRPLKLATYKVSFSRHADTESGAVTLSAKLKKYGFTISIR